jgi:hypothetical protein
METLVYNGSKKVSNRFGTALSSTHNSSRQTYKKMFNQRQENRNMDSVDENILPEGGIPIF